MNGYFQIKNCFKTFRYSQLRKSLLSSPPPTRSNRSNSSPLLTHPATTILRRNVGFLRSLLWYSIQGVQWVQETARNKSIFYFTRYTNLITVIQKHLVTLLHGRDLVIFFLDHANTIDFSGKCIIVGGTERPMMQKSMTLPINGVKVFKCQ